MAVLASAGDRPTVQLLVEHASELVTVAGASHRPKVGAELRDVGIIRNGAVAAADGRIVAVGSTAEVRGRVQLGEGAVVLDASGKTVLPGFVDPHTHLVYAGSREGELVLRLMGRTYPEILAAGGGILTTVDATRRASAEQLLEEAARRLDAMLAHGVTTVEVKSGYGLRTRDELKMLEVVRELGRRHPVHLVPTFLGAHAVPPEFRDDPDGYVELVIQEMMPEVAGQGLAEFCDVFCEDGVFSVEQSRRILEAGLRAGLRPKIHADEFAPLGGAELAADVGAVSADHLVQVSERGIRRLAEAGVVAVLLPVTTLFLMGERYAPARSLIDAGVPVALATDCNPGTAPTESLSLAISLACLKLRMLPSEAIAAATINAAHAVGRAHEVGSLEVGKRADMVIAAAPNHQFIPYKVGLNLVETVIIDGRVVLQRAAASQDAPSRYHGGPRPA